jgi:hypothetical protein
MDNYTKTALELYYLGGNKPSDHAAVEKIAAILSEAFPDKPEPLSRIEEIDEEAKKDWNPEPAKDETDNMTPGQDLATAYYSELGAERMGQLAKDVDEAIRADRLARPEPSSGEPLLPWRDSLEIAIAECTKLQRYLASESAVRREAQARAENAEAAWEAAVEQIKIEQGMKEKAEGEAKALRGLLEKWAVFIEYMARDDAPLAPGTARLFDKVSTATRAALAQGEGGKL